MSPTQITPELANPSGAVGLVAHPRMTRAADCNDVMREQLEFLIEHAGSASCDCPLCQRYLGVKTLLLEAFTDKH